MRVHLRRQAEDVVVESLHRLCVLVVHEVLEQSLGLLLWDGPVLARPQFLRSGVLLQVASGRLRRRRLLQATAVPPVKPDGCDALTVDGALRPCDAPDPGE